MQDDAPSVFAQMASTDHEQVVHCQDSASGLSAIIAIHNTALGPALGGCRMYPYASHAEALKDVLRLSRGMTYKAAVSGLNLGGGKAVIVGDPKKHKSETLWRALGRFIDGLGGRYITAEDSGSSLEDMETIRQETRHVVGFSRALGGSGDPSPVTALGVFSGMRAAIEEGLGHDRFEGLRVAVQGTGNVGYHLIGHLVRAGAHVIVTDKDADALARVAKDFPVEVTLPDAIYSTDCDVFAPCAMGGSLNAHSIAALRCKVVAGAANNQLAVEAQDGQRLADRHIVYAPDYVINAGGLINVASELEGYHPERALAQAKGIYTTLTRVFAHARERQMLSYAAANALAQDRLTALSQSRRIYRSAS
jgi:leucine dehydrogenase